jgi:hypothetical protein
LQAQLQGLPAMHEDGRFADAPMVGRAKRMLAMAAILAVSGPARVGRRQYSMLYIRYVRTKSVLSKPKTVSLPRDYVVAGCALPWEIAVRDGYFIL